ncbi:MAG: FAD:protein FMN transferase [Flavobacteriaceae bacterium]
MRVILLFTILFYSCKKEVKHEVFRLQGTVFGTTYNIIYKGEKNYQKSIDSLFYLVNKSVSTYLPTSDISKINKGDSLIVVDEVFSEVFKKSKRIFKETEGYFDPTVGNLVNAWGFGPKMELIDLDSTQVKKHMLLVGLNKVSLVEGRIKKDNPNIYLDFNSIAKGYGIDVVGRFLESQIIADYLIEIGGEIRARGKSPKDKPWRVGIDNPNTDGSRTISNFVDLSNMSMASSGNYRKYRISKSGKKYVHTINPKTGFAKESNLLAATVYAPTDCADVDAYATAFMAMGLEKTKLFVKKYNSINVVLIYMNEKGEIEKFTSK